MNFSLKSIQVLALTALISGCGPTMPRNPEYKNAVYTFCKNTVKARSSSGIVDQASLSNIARLFDEDYNRCVQRKSQEYRQIESSQRIALEKLKKEEDERIIDDHLTQTCLDRRMNPIDETFKLCKMQVLSEIEQAYKAEQMEKRLRAQMREMEYDAAQRESSLKSQMQFQKLQDDLLKKMQDDLDKKR